MFGFRGLGSLGSRGFTVKGLERVALGVSTVGSSQGQTSGAQLQSRVRPFNQGV